MTRLILPVVVSFLVVCGMTSDVYAKGRIPILIIWGHGEKLTDLDELPPDVSEAVAKELGASVRVGFLNERMHVYYCDLWTWNGRHVLRSGDRYWVPDTTMWREMIGADPSDKYGAPILYTIPLLPALLAGMAFAYIIRRLFFKTEQEKLDALIRDARYQKALTILFGASDNPEQPQAIPVLDERKLIAAKDHLIGEGVAADVAEPNLQKLAEAVLADSNARIDTCLAFAAQLDHQGEWGKSAEIYAQLIASLPDTDDRQIYAGNCLAAVNEKQSSIASPPATDAEPA